MKHYEKSLFLIKDQQPGLINPSPALLIALPGKILPNKLAHNVPDNILINPSLCF